MAKHKRKNRIHLQQENQELKVRLAVCEERAGTAGFWEFMATLAKGVCAVAIVYFATPYLPYFAGKNTSLFLSTGCESCDPWMYTAIFAVLVSLGSIAIRHFSNKSNERKVSELSQRNKNLEKMIDPNRTSSQLAPTGKSNPADKV